MSRPLFQLSPRLALCAKFVRSGSPLCDVGTDHAYLPIRLLKSGVIPTAVAADVNQGPLDSAAQNAERYHVGDSLSLRLSDGLREVAPDEADDIVIAGMGGELILRIIEETAWLRDKTKRLILQPMSAADDLRCGLSRLGFEIGEELAVEDSGKVYTAFYAEYIGAAPKTDMLYPYLGKLKIDCDAAEKYAQKQIRTLQGRLEGAKRGKGGVSPKELESVAAAIESLCTERKNHGENL